MAEPYLNCPEKWLRGTLEPDARLGLILAVETGSTPSTTNEVFWDGDIPWLTPKEISNFREGVFISTTERNITRSGLASISSRIFESNTVMLTKRAPVGYVAVNAVPMTTNQGFLNFRCGPLLRPLYLAYWLRANKPYLDLVANGSTYPELYISDLFEFEISVPSLDEQDKIIEIISAIQYISLLGLPLEQGVNSIEKMLKIQRQNKRLFKIRDAILPLLLSGKLDVSKVSDHFSEVI
jgi:type I restriction enzyme S subunit